MTTPNFGFPFPTLGDPPHVPAAVEALAEAVDAELFAGRTAGRSVRASNSSSTQGVIDIAPAVVLAAAPAGVYQINVAATFYRGSGGGTAVSLVIRAGGAVIVNVTTAELVDNYTRTTGWAAQHTHPGGSDLTIAATLQPNLAPITVRASSAITVHRIA